MKDKDHRQTLPGNGKEKKLKVKLHITSSGRAFLDLEDKDTREAVLSQAEAFNQVVLGV